MHEIRLGGGQSLRVDTGCLVAMEESVDYDIETVPGIKTALFGGEGLFLARLRGPGRVLLQTMPFSRLADRILSASAHMQRGGGRSGVAGGIAGLGAASILGGLMNDNG
jgi:uncharacterized protein (AIM24 family)